jgi:hypothetical protein
MLVLVLVSMPVPVLASVLGAMVGRGDQTRGGSSAMNFVE